MNYLFWLIVPVAIWMMAWIIIDFMVNDGTAHELEDIVKCKWGKENE